MAKSGQLERKHKSDVCGYRPAAKLWGGEVWKPMELNDLKHGFTKKDIHVIDCQRRHQSFKQVCIVFCKEPHSRSDLHN